MFFSRLIKSEPTVLVRSGQMIRSAMKRERVVEAEIYQSLRTAGLRELSEVDTIILETDGTLSVIPADGSSEDSSSSAPPSDDQTS